MPRPRRSNGSFIPPLGADAFGHRPRLFLRGGGVPGRSFVGRRERRYIAGARHASPAYDASPAPVAVPRGAPAGPVIHRAGHRIGPGMPGPYGDGDVAPAWAATPVARDNRRTRAGTPARRSAAATPVARDNRRTRAVTRALAFSGRGMPRPSLAMRRPGCDRGPGHAVAHRSPIGPGMPGRVRRHRRFRRWGVRRSGESGGEGGSGPEDGDVVGLQQPVV